MKYAVVLVLFLLVSNPVFAQADYIKHKVAKKETVADIARKYKVTPYDIYRLNPDAKNGIKENSVLLVPKQSKPEAAAPVAEQPTKVANTIHEVQAKETLYSLAKKYNVSVDELKKANGATVDNGLQIGQKVIIPVKGSAVKVAAAKAEEVVKTAEKKNPPSYFYHTVAAGETKYSIAKQYGMSLQLLETLNPEVKDKLPLGYKLKLDKNAIVAKETQPETQVVIPASAEYIMYKVQPKETLYSLTKRTGLTEAQLIALNPELKEGLKEGMEIKLPGGTTVASDKTKTDLTSSLRKSTPKQIALLLPFNLAKTESDTLRMQRLRNEKFLNMTLDFYTGALMAIDSARVLGIPVKVKVLDSKEGRNTSDVAALKSSLTGMNAVIGPFFQGNVEAAAAMLPGIPVISPLSKESGKAYSNLFQSVPAADRVKSAMLDYLRTKDGSVIAVVDAKKASSRQLIKAQYPDAKFLDGAVTDASAKTLLSKDKLNYVIMETENTNMILNTTKVLAALLPEYRIQLVVLDKTDALDHDEIPINRLLELKMLYPSVTNDAPNNANAAVFNRMFKEKNGVFPNQFATRGFDVTFDVIVRLFQDAPFDEVMDTKATEQVENRFEYVSQNGGNYNNGVFIMQYAEGFNVIPAE